MIVRLIIAVALLLSLTPAGHQVRADTCIQKTLKVSHITGHVMALWRRGEEPIPKASIELKAFLNDEWQTKFTTTSDDKGFFRIENVPSGKYELHVTRENLRPDQAWKIGAALLGLIAVLVTGAFWLGKHL